MSLPFRKITRAILRALLSGKAWKRVWFRAQSSSVPLFVVEFCQLCQQCSCWRTNILCRQRTPVEKFSPLKALYCPTAARSTSRAIRHSWATSQLLSEASGFHELRRASPIYEEIDRSIAEWCRLTRESSYTEGMKVDAHGAVPVFVP